MDTIQSTKFHITDSLIFIALIKDTPLLKDRDLDEGSGLTHVAE
jgi:hypothetical protein